MGVELPEALGLGGTGDDAAVPDGLEQLCRRRERRRDLGLACRDVACVLARGATCLLGDDPSADEIRHEGAVPAAQPLGPPALALERLGLLRATPEPNG